jgi:hypothetical protein
MKIFKSLVVGLVVFGLNATVFSAQGDLLPQTELSKETIESLRNTSQPHIVSDEQKAFDYALNDVNEILSPVNDITQNIDIITEVYERSKEVIGIINNKQNLILKIAGDIDNDAIKGGIRQITKGITGINNTINKIKNSKIMRAGVNATLKSAGKILNKVAITQQTVVLGNQIKKSLDDGFDFVDIADIGIEVVSYAPLGGAVNELVYEKIKGIDRAINSLEESKRIIFKNNTDFALSTIKNENFLKRINGWGKDAIKKAKTQSDLNNVFDNIINEEIKGTKSSIRMIDLAIKDIGDESIRTEFFGLDVGAEDSYIKSLNDYKSMLEDRINNIKNSDKEKNKLRKIFNSNATKHILDDINTKSTKLVKDTKFMSDKQKLVADNLNTIVNLSKNIQINSQNIKEKALNAKNEILAKNKEKQEAKQKQENDKKLAEQTEEVAKLKKAVQTAENLREKNAKLAEQYANNPTKANKDALDKSGKAFANARDNVSEYDNGEYAQTHKYENSFTVDKDRQVKQNFDTALGDMSQKQKDILARADYDSDNFAEGVIGREQAGRDYTQEQADFYALGGGEDKLKNEKDLASLEDFFDKLLKDDDLADVNDDEKTKVGDNENNNELRSIRGSFSYIGIHQNGGDTYSVGSLETRDNNNTFDSMEYLDFSNSGISGGYPAIAPSTTSEASPDVDGYKYTAWGDWSLSGLVADIGGQDYAVDYGHYVMGNTTIDMPSFGNATYNGKLIGGTVGISNNGVVEKNSIGGTIEIGVNFNNSSLSAVLNSTKNNSNWAVARFSNISVQEGGHFHTGFNGTVDGGGVSRIDGKFFGTNAQEVGGSFQISKTGSDADNATGVFRAKQ